MYLEKMLRETGENGVITMQEILSELMENGIRAERKSIYDDIEVLRSFGMDVRFKRGRLGGYYMAGQTAVREKKTEKPVKHEMPEQPLKEDIPGQEAEPEAWKEIGKLSGNSGKKMKLRCSDGIRKETERYFGSGVQYVQKGDGTFTVVAELLEDRNFYGWMTAMGEDVHILKPKKAAQAYRDYLKTLAKGYKGV